MLADSQLGFYKPRLSARAADVYRVLSRRANEVVTYSEMNQILHISTGTICEYVVQIRKIMGARIDVVYKVGYILRKELEDGR